VSFYCDLATRSLTDFRLEIPPFMSYAAAYTLFNYRYHDEGIGDSQYSNLRLIRAFENGLDPEASEAGFVLTHVDMVKHSPALIQGATHILDKIEQSNTGSSNDREGVNQGFGIMLEAMQRVEASMETMWSNSLPKDYNAYRTFIFGITNQSMFPNGVVYQGHNDNRPVFFRGESGANDSMIPLLDHLLEIPMPANPLTTILREFRSYRPLPHRQFLNFVMSKATELGVAAYCRADPTTTVLYLRLLDHVRSFRWRHWLFAREYIIKRSKHPTATGGSPIVTWLPNQLLAVMDLMLNVYDESGFQENDQFRGLKEMIETVKQQRVKLEKEVQKWCQDRGV
jgi:indoleamine 2,3-dioxygenase